MAEELIIKCCAPTLAGLKIGSIFCLDKNYNGEDMKKCVEILRKKGLAVRGVRGYKGQRLIYVYRPKGLRSVLNDRCNECILRQIGYPSVSETEAVSFLLNRIATQRDFPHEIGLFLGYPTDDVKGYIENQGRNFILSGMWKVYCNEEQAKKCFVNYKKCTAVYMNCYKNGTGLERLTVKCS